MKTRVNYGYVPMPASVMKKEGDIAALAEAAKRARRQMEADHPEVVLDALDLGVLNRTEVDKFLKIRYCEFLRLVVAERENDPEDRTVFVTADVILLRERDDLVDRFKQQMLSPEEVVVASQDEDNYGGGDG